MRNLKIHISTLLPRSSPRWRFVVLRKKRRNLYLLPSYNLRLLALPYSCRTATQKPTPVYVITSARNISHETSRCIHGNHISTGIYRCSSLTWIWNFARISERQELARINAFVCIIMGALLLRPQHDPLRLTQDRGFVSFNNVTLLACVAVCNCKISLFL